MTAGIKHPYSAQVIRDTMSFVACCVNICCDRDKMSCAQKRNCNEYKNAETKLARTKAGKKEPIATNDTANGMLASKHVSRWKTSRSQVDGMGFADRTIASTLAHLHSDG